MGPGGNQALPAPRALAVFKAHRNKGVILMIRLYTTDLNGVPIHYAESAGPGPALLFIHGATGSHTTFLPFFPELARYAHVYAVDLRGHGQSGRTPDAYRLADYGRDIAAFLRQVAGRPAVLAGHSLGGYIALWVAAEEPDLVERLFLEDPPIYLTEPSRFQETMFYQFFTILHRDLPVHHARGGTLEDMVSYWGQMPFNEHQTMLDVGGPAWVRERAEQLHALDPSTLEPALAGKGLGDYSPDELLARVHCPTRLLAAQYEFGGAMTAEDVAQTTIHLADCEHTVFTGVGHSIHEERPEAYVQKLTQFIAKVAETR